jgi:hypothetical protein
MAEIKVSIEVEDELEQNDRWAIEDTIVEALNKLGFKVVKSQLWINQ